MKRTTSRLVATRDAFRWHLGAGRGMPHDSSIGKTESKERQPIEDDELSRVSQSMPEIYRAILANQGKSCRSENRTAEEAHNSETKTKVLKGKEEQTSDCDFARRKRPAG